MAKSLLDADRGMLKTNANALMQALFLKKSTNRTQPKPVRAAGQFS